MPPYRHLILPLSLFAATPAQAVHLCAWLDESIEPYEEEEGQEETQTEDAADAEAVANAEDADTSAMDAATAAALAAASAALDTLESTTAEPAADAAAPGPVADDSEPGGTHNLKLWLEADGDASFYFKMAGTGLAQDDGGSGHSPSSGTFVLSAGKPASPWGFGMTFYPPGRVDVVAEIRAFPEDIFADEDPPLITSFAFRRAVPDGETAPPATLAQHQCKDVTFPPEKDR